MSTLATILLVIIGIIALLLVIALFSRKKYYVQRAITINAPLEKVFDYVKQMKNQDNYNKWVMVDPDMKKEYMGVDGTVGFVYAWNGNKKAGQGELELKSITEGKQIETEIRFVRPMPGIAHIVMVTEPVSAGQTKITWSCASELKYPLNIMVSMIENMLGKDMSISLNNLKTILER